MKATLLLIILLAVSLPLFAQPNLDIELMPVNPPIIIPAQGGSFQFTASVVNHGPNQMPFWVWAGIPMPGVYMVTLGPIQINPPVDLTISRLRTQNVPGSWLPDVYFYKGYANTSPQVQPAIDSSIFTFTKTWTTDAGPSVWNASCTGEPFPGEIISKAGQALPLQMGIVNVSPNPFNPTTAICYKLQSASYVSLIVYNTAGRLIITLEDGWREAGTHQVTFDGSKLASGMYLYSLQTNGLTSTGKMILMK